MGKLENTSPANTNRKRAAALALCEECKSNESKYKCPGCSIRSCSLPCVNAHKQRSGCSGKRPKTQFLPLSQFDDNVLLSDFNMLEDVKRVVDAAQRMGDKLCGNPHFGIRFNLIHLQKQARNRRTKLLLLPHGMSKRKTNSTLYHRRKKTIFWTIEWRFHSTDITLFDHGVPESSSFCSVIEKHLKPGPWSHCLKQFCLQPLESLKFFIRKSPKNPRSPFRELDIMSPIRHQLADLVVVEYPVIHVFLPSQSYNFEVIKKAIPCKWELNELATADQSSPERVFFKEEEIADDNSSDPQILDLMKLAKPEGVLSNPDQTRLTNQKLSNTINGPLLPAKVEGSKPVTKDQEGFHKADDDEFQWVSNTEELGEFDDIDFGFDHGLMDGFSDLITDTNPDEFFDLEGVFPEDVILKERTDQINDFVGICPAEEELEEGEIPGF